MKKCAFVAVMVLCCIVFSATAQNNIPLNAPAHGFKILSNTADGFTASLNIAGIKTIAVSTPKGDFMELSPEGFSKIYNLGKPQLPTYNKLIEIPYNSTVEVSILSMKEEVINLSGPGTAQKIMPCQPSVPKSGGSKDIPFFYDAGFYQQDAFSSGNICEVNIQGVMRGVQTGQLVISPFRYNPVQNVLKVYNELVIEVKFHNADHALTEQRKAKYYSPAFEPALHRLANYRAPIGKDVLSKYPIKYVIIAPETIGSPAVAVQPLLEPFVKWKTQKGFTVVEQYYTTTPTTGTVKTFIQNLYNAGTPSDPAPTYTLIVGDIAQIPAYAGTTGSHVSDLYYFTYDGTGDYIPDMYYGRFSATTAAHITTQVEKTLQYEKYTMPEKTYLDTVVMVAGVDANFGYTHANGQILYGTGTYFNAAHGLHSFTHLYPVSGSNAALIRTQIGQGVGFANYTAHCNWDRWGDPEFTVTQISNMSNKDKYGLLIGNCCLSNKFDEPACFGEAMLRTVNKGAVGYIGGSNNTYWDEDYYWGVGKRASITTTVTTYDPNNLGAYDCVFHDHGEPKTSWFITNDQIIYAGNLAVESSNSTRKKYYWEIYHLMGDPSVMNYFGVPDPLAVSYVNPQLVGVTTLQVQTEEDAYVAISHNYQLLDAQLAPPGGLVTLTFPAFTLPDTADIVVTKQNKEPYIGTVVFLAPSLPLDASVTSIVVPEATYSCEGIDVTPEITLTNMGTDTLTSVTISYFVDAPPASTYQWTGNLASMQSVVVALTPITLTGGVHTFTASTSDPNGGVDQNPANDTKNKAFTVTPLAIEAAFSAGPTSFCQWPAQVAFTNQSANAQTYLWDFGDGSTSADASPVHTYTAPGVYSVSLLASAGVCGSDAEIKSAYITVGAEPPVVSNASHCGPGAVTLTASGSGVINWYDAITGGTLLASGAFFNTPVLNSTTTYYVENTEIPSPQTGGGSDINTNGGNFNANASHYLVFDAFVPFTLVSVQVNSGSSGTTSKTIRLLNSSGQQIDTLTVSVPNGISTVTLNWQIPVANDLRLAGTTYPNLWRNDSQCSYPYTIPGVCSIKRSSANTNPTGYYYYFYNWVVQLPSCSSALVPATAEILPGNPAAGFTHSNTWQTVQFINTSASATSYLWDFGDGATSVDANPTHTYAGNLAYPVMLVATNDCGSDTVYSLVDLTTVSVGQQFTDMVSVYPNPAGEKTSVFTGSTAADKIELYDLTGRLIQRIASPRHPQIIDLSSIGAGVYFLRVYSGSDIRALKLTRIE